MLYLYVHVYKYNIISKTYVPWYVQVVFEIMLINNPLSSAIDTWLCTMVLEYVHVYHGILWDHGTIGIWSILVYVYVWQYHGTNGTRYHGTYTCTTYCAGVHCSTYVHVRTRVLRTSHGIAILCHTTTVVPLVRTTRVLYQWYHGTYTCTYTCTYSTMVL